MTRCENGSTRSCAYPLSKSRSRFRGASTDVREGSAVVAERRNLLCERGIDLWHEATRFWCNLFGSMFACDIRQQVIAKIVPPPDTR